MSKTSVPEIPGMDRNGSKRPSPKFWRRSICLFHNFLSQSDAHLNTVDKARLFMIPAERTDGIDNPIQFCQRNPIQKTIQLMEILLNLPADRSVKTDSPSPNFSGWEAMCLSKTAR